MKTARNEAPSEAPLPDRPASPPAAEAAPVAEAEVVPAPGSEPPRRDLFAAALEDPLGFLRRALPWMLVPALLFGALAAIHAWVLSEPVYSARSMVVVRQERTQEDDKMVLPIQGYLQAAHSPRLLRDVRKQLTEEGMDASSGQLGPNKFKSRFIRPDRWESGNVVMLELEVRAEDPEMAARAADLWAESFIAFDDRLSQTSALSRVESELSESYDRILERLDVLGRELETLGTRRDELPQFLELRTTISNRELLQGAAGGNLISQQPNPLYGKLTERMMETEMELSKLEDQRVQTARDLEVLRNGLTLAGGGRSEPIAAQPDPPPSLMEGKIVLNSEGAVELGQAEAGLRVRRVLAIRGNSRLFDTASVPARPESGRGLLQVLAAMIAGAILGFLAAVAREAARAF